MSISDIKENVLDFKNPSQFREWLSFNADKEKECYLLLKRGRPKDDGNFYYLDAIEVALCFGWIDSKVCDINGLKYQRFSPRNKNGFWSELNKERCRRLIKLGLMTPLGLKVLPPLDEEFNFDNEVIKILKNNELLEVFYSFPLLYQKIRIYNILFYKDKNIDTYKKALNHLIEETKKGKMYGEWSDYGRLINY